MDGYFDDDPGYEEPTDEELEIFEEIFEFPLMEMARVYGMHRAEKGDSWKGMSVEQLRYIFNQEMEEYLAANSGSRQEYNELIDILNVGFMLLTRLAEENKMLDKNGKPIKAGDILLGSFYGQGSWWYNYAIVRDTEQGLMLEVFDGITPRKLYHFDHPKFSKAERREVVSFEQLSDIWKKEFAELMKEYE